MTSKHHLHYASGCDAMRPVFRGMAVLLAWVIAGIGFASSSPDVHEHVHHDFDHADHTCAITLVASGFCDTSASEPDVSIVRTLFEFHRPEPASYRWTVPGYWLIPAQAPPARAS